MSDNIDSLYIYKYFAETLDVPYYYRFLTNIQTHPNLCLKPSGYDLYAHINDICIYISSIPDYYVRLLESDTLINNNLIFIDKNYCYELLLPIDNYILLVINDIIKYFKGVIL